MTKKEPSRLGQQCFDQHLQVDGVLQEPLDVKALFKAPIYNILSTEVPVSWTAKLFEAQSLPVRGLFLSLCLAEILVESLHVATVQAFTSFHLVLEPLDGLNLCFSGLAK